MKPLDQAILGWVPVLSLFVAILSVIFGPLITLRISRRQVIAPMRQKWIDNLRDRVSEFVAAASWLYRQNYEPGDSAAERNLQSVRIVQVKSQIELMLNPEESAHVELIQRLEHVRQTASEKEKLKEFPSAVQEMLATCKRILKAEWTRVKRE